MEGELSEDIPTYLMLASIACWVLLHTYAMRLRSEPVSYHDRPAQFQTTRRNLEQLKFLTRIQISLFVSMRRVDHNVGTTIRKLRPTC
jgi:hypothetical protein